MKINRLNKRNLIILILSVCLITVSVTIISAAVKHSRHKNKAVSAESDSSVPQTGASEMSGISDGEISDDSPILISAESLAPESESSATDTAAPNGSEVTVTISAAGDCTLGTDENFDPDTSFNAVFESRGYYEYFFENVLDTFSSDDLTIVNLEGTLTYSDYREDKTFAFKGDPSFVNILTSGSIEACDLANNHSRDYGSESYTDTIQYVEDAGITTFGFDRSPVIEIKGVKVGLVGIYELAKDIECMDDLLEQINSVKELGAQLIITSFHWGDEGEHYPTSTQIELAHAAIDNGSDLVLGHHPHVLQGIETYKGKNIVYSMGNFCFGGNKNPSDKNSMIYRQTFTVKNGVPANDSNYTIIPCRLSSTSEYNDYRPTVLYGEEGREVLDNINTYSEGIYG